jgi:hypothetical protein
VHPYFPVEIAQVNVCFDQLRIKVDGATIASNREFGVAFLATILESQRQVIAGPSIIRISINSLLEGFDCGLVVLFSNGGIALICPGLLLLILHLLILHLSRRTIGAGAATIFYILHLIHCIYRFSSVE